MKFMNFYSNFSKFPSKLSQKEIQEKSTSIKITVTKNSNQVRRRLNFKFQKFVILLRSAQFFKLHISIKHYKIFKRTREQKKTITSIFKQFSLN